MQVAVFCTSIIRWSFYLLFFLVPIVFNGDTKELFEFNKMWLTFGLAIVILAAWITKMIAQKQIKIQRTFFDIPLLLFLLSQLVSTIFSIDSHISFWGYYERFNGGFLSLLTYAFLYYAFASNLGKKDVWKMIQVSLASGLFVALWGLPSHFGYDPSCFVFRGNFDVSCWTASFQPKVRIFSTIGQPDWLAAYLSALLPISLVYTFNELKKKSYIKTGYYALLSILFYVDILYTKSKGSFISLIVALPLLFALIFVVERKQIKTIYAATTGIILLLLITFFVGAPLNQLSNLNFNHVVQTLQQSTPAAKQAAAKAAQQNVNAPAGELGGTDSGKIRLFVWKGALDAWLHNPILGTGVETFAFAYYRYRPAGHNLTSEWDYLYNKAHNEYLNYLATTGIVGLGTYLAFIALFLFWAGKYIYKNWRKQSFEVLILTTIASSFLTILISNFFGFSVVIINVYFFLFPLFAAFLINAISDEKALVFPFPTQSNEESTTSPFQWISIIVTWLIAVYFVVVLINYWNADKSFALGFNLDRAGQYQNGYQYLQEAVSARIDEPVFWDEVAGDDAILAQALFAQKDTANAQKLAQQALQASTMIVTDHPNNLVFWKTRVRVMYALSQIDPKYLQSALDAIKTAQALAPTDAKISYNLGLLYAQNSDIEKGIETLQQTTKLKPDYRDAYYGLGILLHQAATDKNSRVIDLAKQKQAVAAMHYILDTLKVTDPQAKEALVQWGEK